MSFPKIKKIKFGRVGHISEIRLHSNGKHATVHVKHGRKPAQPKKGGMAIGFDDRPESTMTMPKEDAQEFHVGQQVATGIAPMEQDDDSDDQDAAMGDYDSTVRGIIADGN